ncbi:uncharacterized protein [Dermacentor albipictus]|uniref:uncharacterized protein isoform X2 n=1 Tax=Dermacentor albipictus TaxID=60249 RepID=UPI0038FC8347
MSPSESWTDKEDATFPIVPRTSSLSAFGPGFSLRSLVTPSGSRRRRKRSSGMASAVFGQRQRLCLQENSRNTAGIDCRMFPGQ